MIKIIFLIGSFLIFYTYFGYGLLLWLYWKIVKNKKRKIGNFTPTVTLVIAAYNEQEYIRQKIENCLALDYPQNKLSLMFITDGSTDNTPHIIKEYPQVLLLHASLRKGKIAALNRAMQLIETPVVIFTDANTLLNKDCIKNIVRHYSDERIGGVAGEKRVSNDVTKSAVAGEGIYWRYESFLKKLDSQFYTVVGAAGEIFSIRTKLYQQIEENVILDDFIISLFVCLQGYRVVYESNAVAIETSSFSIKEEQKRKIRISAGSFQAIILLKNLLNPFRNFKLFFQYLSHRVFRWTLCPLLLPFIFGSNMWLYFKSAGMIYNILFFAQIIFYLLAIVGWILANRKFQLKIFYLPYYFLFMNISIYQGFFRFIQKNQSVLWEKAAR